MSDRRGDLLLTYATPGGEIDAVTRSTSAGSFGPTHRLSGPGVDPGTVTSAYGPGREAIVAWSRGQRTFASVYGR